MPTRPTQQDVSLALLAFDAYNRGANAQLMYTDEQRLATTIGDADWQRNSDNIAGATAVGFSASSYSYNSKKVISYRGTDFVTDTLPLLETLKDIGTGWLASFGAAPTSLQSSGRRGRLTPACYSDFD